MTMKNKLLATERENTMLRQKLSESYAAERAARAQFDAGESTRANLTAVVTAERQKTSAVIQALLRKRCASANIVEALSLLIAVPAPSEPAPTCFLDCCNGAKQTSEPKT